MSSIVNHFHTKKKSKNKESQCKYWEKSLEKVRFFLQIKIQRSK